MAPKETALDRETLELCNLCNPIGCLSASEAALVKMVHRCDGNFTATPAHCGWTRLVPAPAPTSLGLYACTQGSGHAMACFAMRLLWQDVHGLLLDSTGTVK